MIIAIDGPAGVGKTSVAKEVAKMLDFNVLDTGALYRCIAYYALSHNIDIDDAEQLANIALTKKITTSGNKIFIGSEDVSNQIRTAEVDKIVTPVSACKEVREALLPIQRKIASTGNWVVEGRDIGTMVFPNAEVKIFLSADNITRALRRKEQNKNSGIGETEFNIIVEDMQRRDVADSNREFSPLAQAEDAYALDNTNLSLHETAAFIYGFVEGHISNKQKTVKTDTTQKAYVVSKYQSPYIDGTIIVPICTSCGIELSIRNVHGQVGNFCDSCGKRILNPNATPKCKCHIHNDEIIGLCYITEEEQ